MSSPATRGPRRDGRRRSRRRPRGGGQRLEVTIAPGPTGRARRRSGQAARRAAQSGRQRHHLRAGRAPRSAWRRDRAGRPRHACRVRRRPGHSGRGSVARVRAVLPRRQVARARPGRHRARPGDRQAPGRAARRNGVGRQSIGRGSGLLDQPASRPGAARGLKTGDAAGPCNTDLTPAKSRRNLPEVPLPCSPGAVPAAQPPWSPHPPSRRCPRWPPPRRRGIPASPCPRRSRWSAWNSSTAPSGHRKHLSSRFPRTRDRPHRPLRLRQEHLPATSQPDERPRSRARGRGHGRVDGEDIYQPGTDVVDLRRGSGWSSRSRIPSRSPSSTTSPTARVNGMARPTRGPATTSVEESLRARRAVGRSQGQAAAQSALALSGGQQQRLCIARAWPSNRRSC